MISEAVGENEPVANSRRHRAAKKSPTGILIVDDDRATLLALSTVLQDLADRIVCATSSDEALRRLLKDDFALILLDVVMPGLDGYEAAAMIRRRERSRNVPIIFLSAVNRDDAHMFRGYSAGAVDYVFKPVEPLVLRSKVATFVELHRKTEEIRSKGEMERRLLAENLRARTDQMRTVQALERSNAQRSLIIETLPIALYVASSRDRFAERRFVGGQTERLCGFEAEAFERNPALWLERVHRDDREQVGEALARLGQSGTFLAEYRWQCADGSYRHYLDHGVLAGGSGRAPQEMFGTWLDVSERRLLEQQLTHSQKMKAVGQLTGGIAHDFNNMLTVIIGSLDRLRKQAPGADAERHISIAMQGAQSCADLTRRLLGFARHRTLQQRPVDLNRQLVRLRGLLERTLGERIAVEIDCAEALWTVSTDSAQLESAVLNLVINARDAMSQGGQVMLATANRILDERAGSLAGLAQGEYVELSVRDTGSGMAPEVLERAFEPFFTTKPSGKGTGLGLSTIYGFAKQSNGGITIESQVGLGTTVRIYLPRAEQVDGQDEAAPTADGEALELAGKTVLIVEDEPRVRDVAVAALRDLGCEIVQAGDGAEALKLLHRRKDVVLLFTDWVMPGDLDGRQLAEEAMRRRPGLRVLFTSAHGDGFLAELPPDATRHFVPKPYRAADLAGAIRAALT
ncbi:MAG: response regulator [Kiloniellales bacterium]